MRQAGRYLPEYRAIRQGRTMLETVRTPELAAEITLMPLRRFDLDAAILFSDLTLLFTPMGAPFEIREGVGPVLERPVRTAEDLAALRLVDPYEGLGFTMETIRLLKPELRVPLIGFTGAPFTLATYLVEGGPSKDHLRTRALMLSEPALWHRLMETLAENVARYLSAQVQAGADAVQLFDSWVGVLSENAYRTYLMPHMKALFERLEPLGVPVIHFGTGNPTLLPTLQEAGGHVIGVDYRIGLREAAALLPRPTPLQGNLDPAALFAPPAELERAALEVLDAARGLPGHIFNLGHGIHPQAPIESVQRLVEIVHGERLGAP